MMASLLVSTSHRPGIDLPHIRTAVNRKYHGISFFRVLRQLVHHDEDAFTGTTTYNRASKHFHFRMHNGPPPCAEINESTSAFFLSYSRKGAWFADGSLHVIYQRLSGYCIIDGFIYRRENGKA